MILRIVYYLLATVLGAFTSLIVLGSGVHTRYFLKGENVDSKMLDANFLARHLLEIKTTTVVDYDGVVSMFVGRATDLMPAMRFNGDMTTPSVVNLVVFALNTLFVVAVAWLIRKRFKRRRAVKVVAFAAGTEGSSNKPLQPTAPKDGAAVER